MASGVFAIPFLVIVIQDWLKARSEGADEGNKGVLSSMRIDDPVLEKVANFSQGSLKHGGGHSVPDGMEVMDRTMTMTDLQRVGGYQSGRQVVFGLTHCRRNVHERQQCGNGG